MAGNQKLGGNDTLARITAFIALLAALGPFTSWMIDRYFPRERMYLPHLTLDESEVIYADSRYVALTLANDGDQVAEGVVAVIETYRPGFVFDDATHKGHTHVIPPTDTAVTVSPKKVTIKLESPLAAKQRVTILMDRLSIRGDIPPMFHASASSKQGRVDAHYAFDFRRDRHSTEDFGPSPADDFAPNTTNHTLKQQQR